MSGKVGLAKPCHGTEHPFLPDCSRRPGDSKRPLRHGRAAVGRVRRQHTGARFVAEALSRRWNTCRSLHRPDEFSIRATELHCAATAAPWLRRSRSVLAALVGFCGASMREGEVVGRRPDVRLHTAERQGRLRPSFASSRRPAPNVQAPGRLSSEICQPSVARRDVASKRSRNAATSDRNPHDKGVYGHGPPSYGHFI